MVSSCTTVAISPKKFKDISLLSANQQVSTIGKAVRVSDEEEITSKLGKKLVKQDCILCDSDAQIRVVLWESDVGRLIE